MDEFSSSIPKNIAGQSFGAKIADFLIGVLCSLAIGSFSILLYGTAYLPAVSRFFDVLFPLTSLIGKNFNFGEGFLVPPDWLFIITLVFWIKLRERRKFIFLGSFAALLLILLNFLSFIRF